MNKEQLCKFSNPEHPKMCGPFSLGAFSYATNGHLLVRVPRITDVPEWEALNEKATVLFDAFDMPAVTAALVSIPDFQMPEPEKCGVCSGAGKTTRCPECDGSGELEFETDYNEYSVECETCHGLGSTIGGEQVCECCDGTGNKKESKRVEVGCTGFSPHYLTMLKELPGMKIAPTEPEKANYFKWNEGDGLIMPMRP